MPLPRTQRRLRDHLVIAAVSTITCLGVFMLIDSRDPYFLWSMGSAYTALALLAATLGLGPIRRLRVAPTPVSIDLRRDLGIWAGIWSLLHTVIGLQVHMRGKMSQYFLHAEGASWLDRIRTDLFGFANHTGLLAAVLVALLLATSNDASLRQFGARRWKRIQQSNYLVFALVICHAVAYQLIEKRSPPYAVVLGGMAAAAMTLQAARRLLPARRSAGATSLNPPAP